jgi:agmatinase
MALVNTNSLKNRLALLGICSDVNSSFLRGTAAAPPLIRAALHSHAGNPFSENGIAVATDERFLDLGDRHIAPEVTAFMGIEEMIAEIVANGAVPLLLGGDHAITYPIVRGITRQHRKISILHFDAHPDLYDELDGNRLSHACPFARIMEEGLVQRLVQVGIRTLNDHQRWQAERFGVEIHEMRSLDLAKLPPHFDEPLYISFDLDVLDPAFAPGVSHPEPGGLSVREAIAILHRIDAPIIGADVVEYNPTRDLHGLTAVVVAKFVKEIGGLILKNIAL